MAPLIASGACPTIPATANIGGTGGGTLTASFSVNSDGTTTSTFTGNPTITGRWYSPSGGSPGNFYYVSFHLTSGTTWSAGLTDGTVYALSSVKTVSWTTSGSVAGFVNVNFWNDAGGTQSAGVCALDCSIN